ncbi:MAG TPA: DedA family protein [Solirubrobacteraceae bacterium]
MLVLALFHVSPHLGYLAVAVLVGLESMGVPSPGETALVAGAIAASTGKLDIVPVIALAAAAAIIGDNIGYAIGRAGGRKLLLRPGPFQARRIELIEAGDQFFARHGGKAVFFGRWVALVRVTAAWMAGANHMPRGRFFVYNALGGISWAVSIGLVAYALGETGAHVLTRAGTVGAAIVGAVLLVLLLVWHRRRVHRRRAAAADD